MKRFWWLSPLLLLALNGCQKQEAQTVKIAVPPGATAPATALEDADLIRVNGRGFTQADVDFAGLMLKLQILSQDATADEKTAALKRLDNVNIRLNHVIERFAMGLLGEDKHYSVPEAQIDAQRASLQSQMDAHPEMRQATEQYGTDRFNGRIHEYLRQQVIHTRIVTELLSAQKLKNPGATPKELDYNTAQAYDDLFQDQMGDLDVQIDLRGLPPVTSPAPTSSQPAPTLDVRSAEGQPYLLAQPTTSRPLLVNFWATWCGPCREELPLLLQAKASGKYDVLLVNMDESPRKVEVFLTQHGLSSLSVAYGKTSELRSKGWNIPGLPTTSQIGPGWTQLGQHFGPLKAGMGWLSGI